MCGGKVPPIAIGAGQVSVNTQVIPRASKQPNIQAINQVTIQPGNQLSNQPNIQASSNFQNNNAGYETLFNEFENKLVNKLLSDPLTSNDELGDFYTKCNEVNLPQDLNYQEFINYLLTKNALPNNGIGLLITHLINQSGITYELTITRDIHYIGWGLRQGKIILKGNDIKSAWLGREMTGGKIETGKLSINTIGKGMTGGSIKAEEINTNSLGEGMTGGQILSKKFKINGRTAIMAMVNKEYGSILTLGGPIVNDGVLKVGNENLTLGDEKIIIANAIFNIKILPINTHLIIKGLTKQALTLSSKGIIKAGKYQLNHQNNSLKLGNSRIKFGDDGKLIVDSRIRNELILESTGNTNHQFWIRNLKGNLTAVKTKLVNNTLILHEFKLGSESLRIDNNHLIAGSNTLSINGKPVSFA